MTRPFSSTRTRSLRLQPTTLTLVRTVVVVVVVVVVDVVVVAAAAAVVLVVILTRTIKPGGHRTRSSHSGGGRIPQGLKTKTNQKTNTHVWVLR